MSENFSAITEDFSTAAVGCLIGAEKLSKEIGFDVLEHVAGLFPSVGIIGMEYLAALANVELTHVRNLVRLATEYGVISEKLTATGKAYESTDLAIADSLTD